MTNGLGGFLFWVSNLRHFPGPYFQKEGAKNFVLKRSFLTCEAEQSEANISETQTAPEIMNNLPKSNSMQGICMIIKGSGKITTLKVLWMPTPNFGDLLKDAFGSILVWGRCLKLLQDFCSLCLLAIHIVNQCNKSMCIKKKKKKWNVRSTNSHRG